MLLRFCVLHDFFRFVVSVLLSASVERCLVGFFEFCPFSGFLVLSHFQVFSFFTIKVFLTTFLESVDLSTPGPLPATLEYNYQTNAHELTETIAEIKIMTIESY